MMRRAFLFCGVMLALFVVFETGLRLRGRIGSRAGLSAPVHAGPARRAPPPARCGDALPHRRSSRPTSVSTATACGTRSSAPNRRASAAWSCSATRSCWPCRCRWPRPSASASRRGSTPTPVARAVPLPGHQRRRSGVRTGAGGALLRARGGGASRPTSCWSALYVANDAIEAADQAYRLAGGGSGRRRTGGRGAGGARDRRSSGPGDGRGGAWCCRSCASGW